MLLTIWVTGSLDKKVALDPVELAKFPSIEIAASDHRATHHYSGVLVSDILGLLSIPKDESLKDKSLNLGIRITGNDNYSVVFALAEFHPRFSDRSIILADHQDGQPLPDNAAPFRVVVPGDGNQARWVRQVKSIEMFP